MGRAEAQSSKGFCEGETKKHHGGREPRGGDSAGCHSHHKKGKGNVGKGRSKWDRIGEKKRKAKTSEGRMGQRAKEVRRGLGR